MFMPILGVVVERNIFCLLCQLELSGRSQTLGQGGLAVQLMRKSLRFQHGLSMIAGRLRQSGIELQRRRARMLTRLVGEYEQLLFGLKIIRFGGNVDCSRLECGLLRLWAWG